MSRGDDLLVEKALAKDGEAFRQLYEKYVKKIYNLVYRLLKDKQDVDEVTQEVFFQAYKNLPRFQGKSQFYTWLYRVATNTALQFRRKKNRRRGDSSYENLEENAPQVLKPSESGDPSGEVERRERRDRIRAAIRSLPHNQRVVMVLGPIQGLSYEEISGVLGVSVTVIKGRLHRARENLRERYDQMKKNHLSSITFAEGAGLTEMEAYTEYERALPEERGLAETGQDEHRES